MPDGGVRASKPYPLSEEFQRSVAALAARSPRFWSRVGSELRPERFSDPASARCLQAVADIARETGSGPGACVLVLQRLTERLADGKVTHEELEGVRDLLCEAEDLDEDGAVLRLAPTIKQDLRDQAVRAGIEAFGRGQPLSKFVELEERACNFGAAEPPSPDRVADRLRLSVALGARRSTGLAPLDRIFRGGLRPEKLIVLGGAPGAGKTTLAVQVADCMVRGGAAVVFVAYDEEPAGIDARRLQALGVRRELAEEPDEETILLAGTELDEAKVPFRVLDGGTVEEAFDLAARRYGDRPRLIVIDSLQRAKTRRSGKIESPRERVDDVLATCKRLARATKTLVIVTSELARGAYRSKNSADNYEDLASGKESGGIEYQAHALLVLRSAKGDGDLVDVSVPKNRMGPKEDFALRLDRERCVFTPEAAHLEKSEDDRVEALAQRALQKIEELGGDGVSMGELRERLKCKKPALAAALDCLGRQGKAHSVGAGRSHRWRLGGES